MQAVAFEIGVPLLFLALALAAMMAACWRAIMAERRARLLLCGILTAAEYEQVASRGYLEVPSPSVQ